MKAKHLPVVVLLFGLLAGMSACHSTSVSSEGTQGILLYTIDIDYDLDGSLTEESLATGITHPVHISLTEKGADRIPDPWNIHHRVRNGNIVLENVVDPLAPTDVPDLRLRRDYAGSLSLEAIYEDETLDSITLHFERCLDAEMYIEAPDYLWGGWEEKTGETIVIETGDYAYFAAIPLDSRGFRLVGRLRTNLDIEPLYAVVPGSRLTHSYTSDLTAEGGFTITFPQTASIGMNFYIPLTRSHIRKTFEVMPDVDW